MNKMSLSDRVFSLYKHIDMKLMPLCIEKAYKAEKVEKDLYLLRLHKAIEYYNEFKATYVNRTTRNVDINDTYDLIAYMLNNSRMKNPFTSKDEVLIIEAIKIEPDDLFLEYKRILNDMYADAIAVFTYIKEQSEHVLVTISDFVKKNYEKLYEQFPYINDNLFQSIGKLKNFYGTLSIEDRYEIASGEWETKNLKNKPIEYILFVKLMFDHLMDRELYFKHPHLIAIRGNEFDIVRMIASKFDKTQEREVRMSVAFISGVANIDEGKLVSKCLASLQC